MARAKAGPVVTDNGNFIVDAPFSEAAMKKPREVRYTYSAQGRPTDTRSAPREYQTAYWGS